MNEYRANARSWARHGVAVVALLLAACGGSDGEETVAADNAVVLGAQDVAAATLADVGGGVVLTGTLNPYRVADVKAQAPGTVTALRVREGSAVSNGQVMATIDAQGIRSQASGAQAGAAAARANLALARRQLESARTLYTAGAISELDFRSAQTQYEAAQAQVAAARAQATTAGEAAARTTVRAPFAGEVSARSVEEGEAVNPGQTLFRVVNTEALELAGRVPVDQAGRIRTGQPVEFALTAYPGRTFRGEVARVEPTADPATRQIGVYVRLANPNRQLVGGLFATGQVQTGAGAQSVVVPISAVRGSGADTYVWVIENGVITRRPVTTAARDDAQGVVAIASGLTAGTQVVVSPAEPREGTRVRPAGSTPASATSAAKEN